MDVVATRGGEPETSHRVAVAVVRPDGSLIASHGDPDHAVLLRSTAKPFQAQALFHSGAQARYHFDDEELAIICASHNAAPAHLTVVRRILDKIGLDAKALACGAHEPLDLASRDAVIRADQSFCPVHNNCSGKHAGMLASALSLGAPTRGYLEVCHPLQDLIRETHEALGDAAVLQHGIDGCSAPTWRLTLRELALMYARLADPTSAPPRYRDGLNACFRAMSAHPDLVAGEGAIDTQLMRAVAHLVCKRGAAGCYGMASRDPALGFGPVGIGMKVLDGSTEARTPAIVRVLDDLGVTAPASDDLGPLRQVERRNRNGHLVGHITSRFHLWRDGVESA